MIGTLTGRCRFSSEPNKRSMLPYRVFLLTCWQEEDVAADPERWRFRLEEPNTGEQHGFADLEALTAFLQASLQKGGGDGQDGLLESNER